MLKPSVPGLGFLGLPEIFQSGIVLWLIAVSEAWPIRVSLKGETFLENIGASTGYSSSGFISGVAIVWGASEGLIEIDGLAEPDADTDGLPAATEGEALPGLEGEAEGEILLMPDEGLTLGLVEGEKLPAGEGLMLGETEALGD